MTAREAYDALLVAMDAEPPACHGIDLFTADNLTKADVAVCAQICATCPLLALCASYASAARPAAGVWAGRLRHGRSIE